MGPEAIYYLPKLSLIPYLAYACRKGSGEPAQKGRFIRVIAVHFCNKYHRLDCMFHALSTISSTEYSLLFDAISTKILCASSYTIYSKTCLKPPLSKRLKLVFKTNYRLIQVKRIAECSKGTILQYFRPSLSYHLPLRSLLCLFLSGRLRQVLLYICTNSL